MLLLKTKAENAENTLSKLLLGNDAGNEGKEGTFGKMLQQLTTAQALGKDGKPILLDRVPRPQPGGETAEKTVPGLQTGTMMSNKTKKASPLENLKEELSQLLNPVLQQLPKEEMASLIGQAKNFLKSQIREIADIKELPKTLNGLVKLAEKMGIEITKITVEQVMPQAEEGRAGQTLAEEAKKLPLFKKSATELPTQELVRAKQAKQQPAEKTVPQMASETSGKLLEPLRTLLHKPANIKETPEAAQKSTVHPPKQPVQQSNANDAAGTPKRALHSDTAQPQHKGGAAEPVNTPKTPSVQRAESTAETPSQEEETKRGETRPTPIHKEPSTAATTLKTAPKTDDETAAPSRPQEKSATPPKPVESATPTQNRAMPENRAAAQTLQAAAMPKPAPETREERSRGSDKHTAERLSKAASAATPQVSAAAEPTAVQQSATSPAPQQPPLSSVLSQLLHGGETQAETSESSQTSNENSPVESKPSQHVAAAVKNENGMELKMSEAKQMVRHFAADMREAVENYKPPFTRIKMKLNPGKLGEVDVTMVQRGNNVHINISSNTAAITTLSQHATELKQQLANNGVNNATMQFSSGNEQQQQRQQQQRQQHAARQYAGIDESEEHSLLYTRMELIVPRYI